MCRTPDICDNGEVPSYVSCRLSLELDIADIGDVDDFASFQTEMEAALGAAPGDIIVLAVTAGSVIVDFDLVKDMGGHLQHLSGKET